jgi:CTP synthase (UTP-ammonia lyase)
MLRIGVLGDFDGRVYHLATSAALEHAATGLALSVQIEWLPTESLLEQEAGERLAAFAGFWGSPGSPYRSEAGMIAGIRYAREHDVPFLGT